MSVEDQIRDYLSTNLSFIDDGLTLIKKEYPVPNLFGSKGYIDLLAVDQFNNFVIIEIKRSKAASRETIQEILKYVGLLKQNYSVRDSEIKIIILSTDWTELLVPYSELLYQTSLDVKGFKITLDASNVPVKKEPVKAIDVSAKRSIARNSMLHLFYTEEKMQGCVDYIINRCQKLSINDFVLVKFVHPDNTKGQSAFPYCLCFAFQALRISEYRRIVEEAEIELDMQEDEFETPSDFENDMEQNLIIAVDAYKYHDSAEGGSPEKIDSIVLVQGWEAREILRFGIFAKDPRYNDEMLLRELRGLDGASQVKYLSFGESTHTDRLKEVEEHCTTPLKDNDLWRGHITDVFSYLRTLKQPYRFVINVYHPLSIFDALHRGFENTDYLPIYLIFIDFIEGNRLWVFGGRLSWNGQPVDLEKVYSYLTDESDAFFNKFLDCVNGMHDQEFLPLVNLSYENTLAKFENDELTEEANIHISDKELVYDHFEARTIFEWLEENIELKNMLDDFYSQYTRGF